MGPGPMAIRQKPSRQNPLGYKPPSLLPYAGQLGSGSRLVGRIGSGVRISASVQKIRRFCFNAARGGGLCPKRGCLWGWSIPGPIKIVV